MEQTQQELAILSNNKGQLQAIVDEVEAAFASFDFPDMSMEKLDEKINEAYMLLLYCGSEEV